MTFYLIHSKQLMNQIPHLLQLMNQLLEEIKTYLPEDILSFTTDNPYITIDVSFVAHTDHLLQQMVNL